jgi:hypothetical protein
MLYFSNIPWAGCRNDDFLSNIPWAGCKNDGFLSNIPWAGCKTHPNFIKKPLGW